MGCPPFLNCSLASCGYRYLRKHQSWGIAYRAQSKPHLYFQTFQSQDSHNQVICSHFWPLCVLLLLREGGEKKGRERYGVAIPTPRLHACRWSHLGFPFLTTIWLHPHHPQNPEKKINGYFKLLMLDNLLRVIDNWNAILDTDVSPPTHLPSPMRFSTALLLIFLPSSQGAPEGKVCIPTANTRQHYINVYWLDGTLIYLLPLYYNRHTGD